MSRNNLRGITLGIRPIWGIYSLENLLLLAIYLRWPYIFLGWGLLDTLRILTNRNEKKKKIIYIYIYSIDHWLKRPFPGCRLPLLPLSKRVVLNHLYGKCNPPRVYFPANLTNFYTRFCTRTCWKTEAQNNSEMIYWCAVCEVLHRF